MMEYEVTGPSQAELESLVNAETRDGELEEIAARLVERWAGEDPVWDGRDLSQRLLRVRTEARRRVRDRLALAAALANGDRQERDGLLRRIAGWDDPADSGRSLAAAVGLSHTAVQKILRQISDRDEALDQITATVTALTLAWDPPPIPAVADPVDDEDEVDFEDDDEDPYGEGAAHEAEYERLRRHESQRQCCVCGAPSRRLVKRWEMDRVSIPADEGDPLATEAGWVQLGRSPRVGADWAVCGTVHARQMIEKDRTWDRGGDRREGPDWFYEVESFRYLPHRDELPPVIAELQGALDRNRYSGQEIARSLHGRDIAGAAYYLKQLRRDIARAASLLARIDTYTPPPRVFTPGWPEPDASDVLQVRHGDVIYANRGRWSWDEPERPDRWAGPAGPGNPAGRYTWDQLTALGELVEIPYERIRLPHDPDHD